MSTHLDAVVEPLVLGEGGFGLVLGALFLGLLEALLLALVPQLGEVGGTSLLSVVGGSKTLGTESSSEK